MGKSSRNKKRAMENLNLFYQDIGTSSSIGRHLTQEEAAKEALTLRISQKFALLEEVNENALVDTPLSKEFFEGGALLYSFARETSTTDINTMPYRIYEQLGREEMKKVDIRITMINHTQAEAMGILTNVLLNTPERLFSTFDGFCNQTFRAARSDVMRNAESDSDDE
ncbi:hypothetical protein Tco_0374475 [Tanacetum coccineum]